MQPSGNFVTMKKDVLNNRRTWEGDLNRCLFAVSKMYVCVTNGSCPSFRSQSRGSSIKRSGVGLIKIDDYDRESRKQVSLAEHTVKARGIQGLGGAFQEDDFSNDE